MRHRKLSKRLGRPKGPRRATLRNLVIGLLKHEKIKTTKVKARLAQSLAERLISLGKQNTLHSRRLAYKILNDKDAVSELFSRIAPLFKKRSSGFSRVIRYLHRQGDGAELAILELTERTPIEKPAKEKTAKHKKEKPAEKAKPVEKEKEKPVPPKEIKPKKFLGGLRRLFKKERDSL